jgi:hypothetical protein
MSDEPVDDGLEQYLDRVCRRIGGPRSLRQHVRQELKEHLLDAADGYRSAGMSREQAVARAIADFGGPDELRAELEATHGHRLWAVVIDNAMQWKERTMRSKLLWSAWAHLALVLVIAAEVFFISASIVFVFPKHQMLARDGYIPIHDKEAGPLIADLYGVVRTFAEVLDKGAWVLLGVAVVWAIFEWRARGESKPWVRLAAMGTVAVGLMAVVILVGAALILPPTLAMPGLEPRKAPATLPAKP